MDLQNPRDNYPKLISHMEGNGYSKKYVGRFAGEIRRILELAGANDWSCYTDVYLEYTKTPHPPSYLHNKRTIIGAIEQFDIHGRYPDGRHQHELFERGSYPLLSAEFKSVIDHYCEEEKKRGKKLTTIYTESNNASTFLLALQRNGMGRLERITEEAVLSVFMSPNGRMLRSYSYKKNIAAVIKACLPYYPEECQRIISSLPALREHRKNIQYLTPEETREVKAALADNGDMLSLRDKAMGLLILHTGLRSCDVAGMTLDSIDWDRDMILIRQQKTEVPLELPLMAVVGNAIYDYLVSERSRTNSPYLFVSRVKPYRGFAGRSIRDVSVRIMKAAGIRQSPGDRKGFHIFRHHLAIALLGNAVPQPVISRILGQTSPKSTEAYYGKLVIIII